MKAWLAFLAVLVVGCATPAPTPATPNHPDPRFRADLAFQADGVKYSGFVILPRKTSTKFVFDLPKETNFFFLNTCGREDPFIYPEAKQTSIEYTYLPAYSKEDQGSCALIATAVTRAGEYYRAVVDFANSTGKDLGAKLFCNGRWSDVVGAAVCQTRAGIPVGVKTNTEALMEMGKGCPEAKELTTRREWEFSAGEGLCGADFMDRAGNLFRLSVLGYTSILNVFPPTGVKK